MLKEFLKTIKQLREQKKNRYLYRSGWDLGGINGLIRIEDMITDSKEQKKKEDKRIDKKPVDIHNEIVSKEPKMDLTNLDEQIKIVKHRADILRDYIGGDRPEDEDEALGFLQARKGYIKYKDKFNWAITTFDLVDKLCKKYKVKVVSFRQYYSTIPKEAIDELEKFVHAYSKVSKLKPVLKLIIDDTPKSPERGKKKDPILLAGSPFGKWFYILGAWDKEVEIVDDLVYNNK